MTATTTWGVQGPLHPRRVRQMAQLHHQLGPLRYKQLRLSMSVARSRVKFFALTRELVRLESDFNRLAESVKVSP